MRKLSPKGYPWVFLFGIFGLLLPFQNCAPAQLCGTDSNSSSSPECVTEDASKTPTTGSGTGSSSGGSGGSNGSGRGTGVVVIGDGSGSGGGTTGGGGGGTTGGSGVVVIGDGDGDTTTGGGGGITSGALRVHEQPTAKTTFIGEDFTLRVVIAGGKTPYSYNWHKDNKSISTDHFWTDTYIAYKAGYAANGVYHVVVTDAEGATVRSSNVRVILQDKALGCRTGSYMTFTNATLDGSDLIPNYLDSPAGKFLVHRSYDQYGILDYVSSSQSGLVQTSISNALDYNQAAAITNCHIAIPRIHTPTRNPSTHLQSNGDGYYYRGQINFKCRNNKLIFISNTCSWNSTPDYPN